MSMMVASLPKRRYVWPSFGADRPAADDDEMPWRRLEREQRVREIRHLVRAVDLRDTRGRPFTKMRSAVSSSSPTWTVFAERSRVALEHGRSAPVPHIHDSRPWREFIVTAARAPAPS